MRPVDAWGVGRWPIYVITSQLRIPRSRIGADPVVAINAASDSLHRNGEHISNTALGLDDARGAGIAFELATEA
jgi:hypothetical protein